MNLFRHLNDREYGANVSTLDCEPLKKNSTCGNFQKLIYPNRSLVGRLTLTHELKKHTGCVNTVAWSACGRYIITGSDDTRICIWDWENNGKLKSCFTTGHTANIFCAKFIPFTNNSRVISCAGDGVINVFDLEESMALKEKFRQYRCHGGSVKKLVTYDDNPHLFLSCSTDGTVRRFDLRENTTNGAVLVSHRKLDINSIDKSKNLFCIGTNDPIVRVYDLRYNDDNPFANYCPQPLLKIIDSPQNTYIAKGHITGVAFKGDEILASYTGDSIYLFDINNSKQYVKSVFPRNSIDENDLSIYSDKDIYGDKDIESNIEKKEEIIIENEEKAEDKNIEETKDENSNTFVQQYSGHCNQRTVKSVAFYGPNWEYVLSGSDDGNVFIWDKKTAKLVNLMKGDECVVNVSSGHPFDPILATVGIDNTVKVFTPTADHINPMANEESVKRDNQERLEAGPGRPISISLTLLRRLLQAANSGMLDLDDSDEEENSNEEHDTSNDDDNSDETDRPTRRRERPDGCPMQ